MMGFTIGADGADAAEEAPAGTRAPPAWRWRRPTAPAHRLNDGRPHGHGEGGWSRRRLRRRPSLRKHPRRTRRLRRRSTTTTRSHVDVRLPLQVNEQATRGLLSLLPGHRAQRLLDHCDWYVDVRGYGREGRLQELLLAEQLLGRFDGPEAVEEVLIGQTLSHLCVAHRRQGGDGKGLLPQHLIEAGYHGKTTLREASHVFFIFTGLASAQRCACQPCIRM